MTTMRHVEYKVHFYDEHLDFRMYVLTLDMTRNDEVDVRRTQQLVGNDFHIFDPL